MLHYMRHTKRHTLGHILLWSRSTSASGFLADGKGPITGLDQVCVD